MEASIIKGRIEVPEEIEHLDAEENAVADEIEEISRGPEEAVIIEGAELPEGNAIADETKEIVEGPGEAVEVIAGETVEGLKEGSETIAEETIEGYDEAVILEAEETAIADGNEEIIATPEDVGEVAIADQTKEIEGPEIVEEVVAEKEAIPKETGVIEGPDSVEEAAAEESVIANEAEEIRASKNLKENAAEDDDITDEPAYETVEIIDGPEDAAGDAFQEVLDAIDKNALDENEVDENVVNEDTIDEDTTLVEGVVEDVGEGDIVKEDAVEEEVIEEKAVVEDVVQEEAVQEEAAEKNTAEENAAEDAVQEVAVENAADKDTAQEVDPAFRAATTLRFSVERSLGYNDQYRTNLEASRNLAGRSIRNMVSTFNTSTRLPPEGRSKALVSRDADVWAKYLHSLRVSSLAELKATRGRSFRLDIVRYYGNAREGFVKQLDELLLKKGEDIDIEEALQEPEDSLKATDAVKMKELDSIIASLEPPLE